MITASKDEVADVTELPQRATIDDPLSPARGCLIYGPLLGISCWCVILGAVYLTWRWM